MIKHILMYSDNPCFLDIIPGVVHGHTAGEVSLRPLCSLWCGEVLLQVTAVLILGVEISLGHTVSSRPKLFSLNS